MSILGLYEAFWSPWDQDADPDDDADQDATEALTITHGRVWWTASAFLDDE